MSLEISLEHPSNTAYEPGAVASSLERLLQSNRLCSISTITPEGAPHINVCFYGPSATGDLVIFTEPGSRHGRNLENDPRFAATVFDSSQPWGGIIFGAQLFGTAAVLKGSDADSWLSVYTDHNSEMSAWAKDAAEIERKFASRLYLLRIEEFTLLDEATFGKESYINGEISNRSGRGA